MAQKKGLAVIFDFDDTLTDDSTAALLIANGINSNHFYRDEVNDLVIHHQWDPTLAYLHMILERVAGGKIKQNTNELLRKFGAKLKPYPGLGKFLKDLRQIATGHGREINFYIISSGIQDIIDGFPIRNEFKAAWGCQLAASEPGGPVKYIKRAITFTEKTRYLFEINKGLDPAQVAASPYLVNEVKDDRPVPFTNMVYLGDGLTDVPCMSLITKGPTGPGLAFGIFRPQKEESARNGWIRLLAPNRVKSLLPPQYGPNQALGSLIRAVIRERCIFLEAQEK